VRPLEDVTVLDLSQFAAGPYGAQLLADHGARVIKLERPGTGDPYRHEGPRLPGGGPDDGAFFLRFNRNKESVAIDLSRPGGRRAFERLVAGADVLIENFKPGSLERLGYPWTRLRELNPRLVYATVTGFGHRDLLESPLSSWPAFAVVAEAMGGLMAVIGDATCRPHSSSVSAGDLVAGMHMAFGVLAALHQRALTGEGQRVDVAMADSIAALAELPVFNYGATGQVPTRGSSRSTAPFGAFPAADGHVAIGVIGGAVWRRFCDAIDRPDLRDDPALATGQGRAAQLADRIQPAIEDWLRHRTKQEAAAYLAERQVPAAPLLDAREVTESPHFQARQMVLEFEYPDAGTFRVTGNPVKLGADASPPVRRPPRLGEHTDAVLRELGGLSAEEVAELRAEGSAG
jgi:crotonobetainyl-CoA:carnitine CoA-transferase CaiB-like acyl-CoA transferase